MTPRILIFGMHRSGTTLVGDLIGKHPAVRKVFHESVLMNYTREQLYSARTLPDYRMLQTKGVLTRARNVEEVSYEVDFDLSREIWAAKMSYPGPVILQSWCNRANRYARRWIEMFEADARIVHVVRHPFDVFCSSRRRWQGDPGSLSNYGPITLDSVCSTWVHAVESILHELDAEPRGRTFRYEDLVESPKDVLTDIFRFCSLPDPEATAAQVLEQDVVFFGKVDASRRYLFRNESMENLSRSTAFLTMDLFRRFQYANAA